MWFTLLILENTRILFLYLKICTLVDVVSFQIEKSTRVDKILLHAMRAINYTLFGKHFNTPV